MSTQTFLTSDTFISPFTGNLTLIQLWGGGFRGENAALGQGGHGGGGGAYGELASVAVTLGSSYTVRVGDFDSDADGKSWFDSGANFAGGTTGQTGATTSGLANAFDGGSGGNGGFAVEGGGGGSGAGPSGAGVNGDDGTDVAGGAGGDGSTPGGGNGGAGGVGGGSGVTGVQPGGGGGGNSFTGGTYGSYGKGKVVLTWTLPTPAPASVSPIGGSTAGGTSVTITGTNFSTGCTVTFGGNAATSVTVVSATSITCTTPAHVAGLVNVAVTNSSAVAGTLTNGYAYFSSGGSTGSRRVQGM